MPDFSALILPIHNTKAFEAELLSCPVASHIALTIQKLTSGPVYYAGQAGCLPEGVTALDTQSTHQTVSTFLKQIQNRFDEVLLFFGAAPAVSCNTLERLVAAGQSGAACLYSGATPVAAYLSVEVFDKLDFSQQDCLSRVIASHIDVPTAEDILVSSPETLYLAQEVIRERINRAHLQNGVMLLSPQTTHISPLARIGQGTLVLPNCQIYGGTVIGENCKIGPNTYLENAQIDAEAKVNASQIYDSSVGARTTVGPFAYIRPGSEVAEDVRIGDFVELKKAKIGKGTKVSHLTYLGDAELGEKINIGCGVVTVNYDGKKKFKTVIGDNSFIGCNVNLVSPVKVESGAYIAAGSTITQDVPEDAMVIARAREVVKTEWVKKRRADGKL